MTTHATGPTDPLHFLSLLDVTRSQAAQLVESALQMKQERWRSRTMTGCVAALIFEKSSTRTRVSFEAAVRHLGGSVLFMTPADAQLGRGEPLKDTARVLSRYVDCLIVRTFGQEKLVELAAYATIPVINALSDMYHPCQLLADVLTMREREESLDGLPVAWVGDGNNMANSWINAAAQFSFSLRVATPAGYEPDQQILDRAWTQGADVTLTHDPVEAVAGAKYVNTDVWASMGQEEEQAARKKIFALYQVNSELLSRADPAAKVMHCLPAHRGEEITNDVIEGPASIVWDQAENRLHAQKALLHMLFEHQ